MRTPSIPSTLAPPWRARRLALAFTGCLAAPAVLAESILFESGALGPTGVTAQELLDQSVPGTNVNESLFVGARFELSQPAVTSRIGGHFAGLGGAETFFGALVALDGPDDFPDSADLSTPDVIGAALLEFPSPSAEVFADLEHTLEPGWYAAVFGSGLFGATGAGAAVRNGTTNGLVSYIRYSPGSGGSGWSSPLTRFDSTRIVVVGNVVPEPTALGIVLLGMLLQASHPRRHE